MVELGERLRFRPVVRRHLESDQPLQRLLPGQEDAGERPLADQGQQVEIVEHLAGLDVRGAADSAARPTRRWLHAEQPAQLLGPIRESLLIFLRGDRLAGASADLVLLEDQVARDARRGQLGELGDDIPRCVAADRGSSGIQDRP